MSVAPPERKTKTETKPDPKMLNGRARGDHHRVFQQHRSDSVIRRCLLNVRITPESGRRADNSGRLKMPHPEMPWYSITSSASNRNSRVIVSPRAFAVFRLMTNSKLVGLLHRQVRPALEALAQATSGVDCQATNFQPWGVFAQHLSINHYVFVPLDL
jgi:hypothetical protein